MQDLLNQEWEAVEDAVSGEWWIEGLEIFVHGTEDDTDEDVAAKAYLVAAAPKMLKAIKDYLDQFDDDGLSDDQVKRWLDRKGIPAMRAALAAAERGE